MNAKELGKKAAEHLRCLERGKKAYKKADAVMDEILKEAKAGERIELPNGKEVTLVDFYAGTNTVFRAHGVHRYGLVADKS